MLRRTSALVFATFLLSVAACGGDDSSSTGGAGTGGTGGSGATGGASGTGGTAGAGTGGATGGKAGSGGTGGASGGGQGGAAGGDASPPMDARADTTPGTDSSADRTGGDAPGADTGSQPDAARDSTNDGNTTDASTPESGTPDAAPDGSAPDAPSSDGSSTLVLTSTAFTEGMTIPPAHTCDTNTTMGNVSPPLSWTTGPAGTLSYAVVLTDKTNNLVHAGIYDIAASMTSLPENVDKTANPTNVPGAKQVQSYSTGKYGYLGPCPGAMQHTYEFMLYAVDVANLPGVAADAKGAALVTALQTHTLGTAKLTGKATTGAFR